MASSSRDDPLELAGLDPAVIEAKDAAAKNKKPPTTELELAKEARLAEKEKRLAAVKVAQAAAAKAATAPPATPPPPQVDKSMLLDKIGAYRERFPHLKKRNGSVTLKSSVDEIIDELHYIEMQLGSSGGSSSIAGTVLIAGMVGVEKFTDSYWNPLGLNLHGLGTVTQQNLSEFQPILDELMIKYHAGCYTSPEWRLVLTMSATIMTVHAANNDPEAARAVKSMHQKMSMPAGAADL